MSLLCRAQPTLPRGWWPPPPWTQPRSVRSRVRCAGVGGEGGGVEWLSGTAKRSLQLTAAGGHNRLSKCHQLLRIDSTAQRPCASTLALLGRHPGVRAGRGVPGQTQAGEGPACRASHLHGAHGPLERGGQGRSPPPCTSPHSSRSQKYSGLPVPEDAPPSPRKLLGQRPEDPRRGWGSQVRQGREHPQLNTVGGGLQGEGTLTWRAARKETCAESQCSLLTLTVGGGGFPEAPGIC